MTVAVVIDWLACGKCGESIYEVDYDGGAGTRRPTLYWCGFCNNWMRRGDKRIKGKCVVCEMLFDDAFVRTKCNFHRWTKLEKQRMRNKKSKSKTDKAREYCGG